MDRFRVVPIVNRNVESALGIPVVTSIPENRPARFIRTLNTGGFPRDAVTDVRRVTVEAWGTSKVEAEQDADAVRKLLDSWSGTVVDGAKISAVNHIQLPTDYPDPVTKTPRFVLTTELAIRGKYNRRSRLG